MSKPTVFTSHHFAVVLGVLLPLTLLGLLLQVEQIPSESIHSIRATAEAAADMTRAASRLAETSPTLDLTSASAPTGSSTIDANRQSTATALPSEGSSTRKAEERPTPIQGPTAFPSAESFAGSPEASLEGAPSIAPFRDGLIIPPPPYFAFGRPFAEPQVVRPTRFYPYGTDAGGQYLLHHGVDISNPLGDNVRAVAAGRVVFAGDDLSDAWGPMLDFYGQLVVIEHALPLGDRPLFSLYGHIETFNVRPGQSVMAGETIATVGGRGIAMGPHLHLEFRTDAREYSRTFNPELFFAPLAGHGSIVVRVRNSDGARMTGVPIALYSLSETGEETWITEVPSYPNQPVNSAWRWDEDAVFGDLPIGRYVVRSRSAFQAGVEVEVRHREVTLVTLAPDRASAPSTDPTPPQSSDSTAVPVSTSVSTAAPSSAPSP